MCVASPEASPSVLRRARPGNVREVVEITFDLSPIWIGDERRLCFYGRVRGGGQVQEMRLQDAVDGMFSDEEGGVE